jgi:hypothetical protein
MALAKNHSKRLVTEKIRTSPLGLNWRDDAFRRRCSGPRPFCHRKLAVPIAALAMSVGSAGRCVRVQQASSAPNYSSPETIEATRPVSNPFKRSPVPMAVRSRATGAQFAQFRGERLKPETRWRRGADLNLRSSLSRKGPNCRREWRPFLRIYVESVGWRILSA